MDEEEPAWRRELVRDLSRYDAYASHWLPLVESYILAAEERGRRQALSAVGAEIEVMLGNAPALLARTAWKSGYEGALTALNVTLDSIMPEQS